MWTVPNLTPVETGWFNILLGLQFDYSYFAILEVSLFKQKSVLEKLSRVGMKVRFSPDLCVWIFGYLILLLSRCAKAFPWTKGHLDRQPGLCEFICQVLLYCRSYFLGVRIQRVPPCDSTEFYTQIRGRIIEDQLVVSISSFSLTAFITVVAIGLNMHRHCDLDRNLEGSSIKNVDHMPLKFNFLLYYTPFSTNPENQGFSMVDFRCRIPIVRILVITCIELSQGFMTCKHGMDYFQVIVVATGRIN